MAVAELAVDEKRRNAEPIGLVQTQIGEYVLALFRIDLLVDSEPLRMLLLLLLWLLLLTRVGFVVDLEVGYCWMLWAAGFGRRRRRRRVEVQIDARSRIGQLPPQQNLVATDLLHNRT